MTEATTTINDNVLALTADIASAYLSQNHTPLADVPALIQTIASALVGLTTPAVALAAATEETFTPAVPARTSVKHEFITSLIDGKQYKTLRRHLGTHGLTPEEYRARYNLKADYPMVAPAYSERRSQMAKDLGLGRKRVETAVAKPKRVRKVTEEAAA